MKKLLIILSAMVLISCSKKPFTGYVVCREYTPAHMCHQGVATYQEAAIVPHIPVVVNRHRHSLQSSTFVVFIANKWEVYKYLVDSLTFIKPKYKLLNKVTILK